MPKHTEQLAVSSSSAEQLVQASYRAFEHLGWQITFVSENGVTAQTPQSWNRYANNVSVVCEEGLITVTSEMFHGEAFDLMGRTRKDVEKFIQAFEIVSQQPLNEESMRNRIKAAQQKSDEELEEEVKQAEEVDKVMKFSKSNLFMTYIIIGINIIVFVLMAIDGAGVIEPNPLVHLEWGSNFSLLTLNGEGWRVFTSTFIHFGILHLLMNMYALYMAGIFLEPMLGKFRYIFSYIACGLLASITSLFWHTGAINSAGASGAVFGLYGIFLSLLLTKQVPDKIRNSLLQTTAIFVGYNLIYGMKGGIDNAAHIGGLFAGLVIGLFYTWTLKQERREKKIWWTGPIVFLVAIGICWMYLNKNSGSMNLKDSLETYTKPQEPTEEKQNITTQPIKYASDSIIDEALEKFDKMNRQVLTIDKSYDLSEKLLKDKINKVGLPYLDSAQKYIDKTKGLQFRPNTIQKLRLLSQYIEGKRKEMKLILEIIEKGHLDNLMQDLESVRFDTKNIYETANNFPLY